MAGKEQIVQMFWNKVQNPLYSNRLSANSGHLVDSSYIFWELKDQVRNELRGER